jgi:hypothetical protein
MEFKMVQYANFSSLNNGDTVRLSGCDYHSYDGVYDDVTLVVARVAKTNRFGWTLLSTAGEHYYEDDGWKIEVIKFVNTLPNTRFIAWVDSAGESQVAVRRNTQTCQFNGVLMPNSEFLEAVGDVQFIPLTQMV